MGDVVLIMPKCLLQNSVHVVNTGPTLKPVGRVEKEMKSAASM